MLAEPLIPVSQEFEVSLDETEYRSIGSTRLLARIYRPVSCATAAAILDVHGGAWDSGDRTQHQALDQALAASGVLVVAIDFRQPPGNPYPTSVTDVNFATRWLKYNAVQLGAVPGAKVGAFGGSSGGHQVLLSAMRPREPRYATSPLPGADHIDASLDFVLADAPVTDPYARLLAAQRNGRSDLVERHYRYWQDDAAAIDGNPLRILERAEQVDLPPLFVSQGTDDLSVPLEITQNFVTLYRKAGGQAHLLTFDGLGHGFILQDPHRPESVQQASAARTFIKQIVHDRTAGSKNFS